MIENEMKTILVVDDTKTNIEILLELLSNKYDIIVALNGETALEIIEEEKIDLVLLDIMMPNMDGYEVCKVLKNNPKYNAKNIPIIFITALTDEDGIEKAYEVGGSDYVTKPFKQKELMARINRELELKSIIEHLEFISSHDIMTGIYNRRKFFELAQDKLEKENNNLYGVMIDIDKFKNINDTYGHSIGDKVIKLLAKLISSNIDKNSIFGRIGGEEFAIVSTHNSLDSIKKEIEELRVLVEKEEVLNDKNEIFKFTISSGIAHLNNHISNIDELLKIADEALYEAKKTGRNKTVLYNK